MSEQELFMRTGAYVNGAAFTGDLFERKKVAKRLTGYIDRLREGCVIGVDARWGEGKSWFAQNWHAYLKEEGYPSIYIDAFQNDFSDDPFLIIAADLIEIAKKANHKKLGKSLTDKAADVGKKILPLGIKTAIGAAGRIVLGEAATEEIKELLRGAPDDVGKLAEKYIERRLGDHDMHKRSVEAFRETLKEFSASQPKPCVVLVDELDRCKPTFAVEFVERIKHFFDVPNLIFVLFINKAQLEAAIRGVYGEGVDASAYLGKFVHFSLSLPKITGEYGRPDFNERFLQHLAGRYKYPNSKSVDYFISVLAMFADAFDLSFRDLERAFILYGLAQPVGESAGLVAYAIALRIGKPEVFRLLSRDAREGHTQALSLLEPIHKKHEDSLTQYMIALHTTHLGSFVAMDSSTATLITELHRTFRVNPERLIKVIFGRVDMRVED